MNFDAARSSASPPRADYARLPLRPELVPRQPPGGRLGARAVSPATPSAARLRLAVLRRAADRGRLAPTTTCSSKTAPGHRPRLRYDVQCCGFVAEVIQHRLQPREERQFRFSIELANIGSIGNFMGAARRAAASGATAYELTRILITGGAGFIGSNFVRHVARAHPDWEIVVLDKLTYAGRRENLADLEGQPRLHLRAGRHRGPRGGGAGAARLPYVVNFAAETHVDRSLYDAGSFIQTDVYGTFVLLEEARRSAGPAAVRADLDRRGLRQRGDGLLAGDRRPHAAQPVLRQQGGRRTGWPTRTSPPTACP